MNTRTAEVTDLAGEATGVGAGVADVAAQFVAVAHRIVWCTVATVDRRGRPRSRVMHPVWFEDGGLHALASARPTPLKRAHLAHAPFVSCSYWDPQHDVAVAECRAEWVTDRRAAWERVAGVPSPVGFDPAMIWPDGPDSPDCAFLLLEPWRLTVNTAVRMAAGEPALTWSQRPGSPARRRRASSATLTG
jgi:Pyridoxamine 5'-phosphate oxidase